ncbi:MAG: hypothetical protein J6Y08_09520 [Clostridiales bacterium]|nr:hypothetical protein [Clostridiales bacterium]
MPENNRNNRTNIKTKKPPEITDHKAEKEIETKPKRYATALLVILSILLVAVSVILVYMISNHIEAKRGAKEQLRLSAIAGFDCEYSEAQQLYPYKNGLLKVTATRVAYLSISGNEIYGVDVDMSNPICIKSGDYAMVADTDGFLCAVFSEEGILYYKHMTGKIGNFALAPSGLSAVIIEEGKSFGGVYIMDKDGSFLAQWSSYESGYPISLAFAPDESSLSVTLVDTDGSQMVPHVKQFAIPSDRTYERPTESAFYTPSCSDIMPLIAYLNNDTIAVAGISDVAVIGDGKCAMVSPPFPCVTSIFSYEGGYAVIYSDGVDQPVRLAIFDQQANQKSEIQLGNQVKDYDVSGSSVLIAVDDDIYLINLDSGKVESAIPVDEPVLRVSFFGTKNICVVTQAGVREISI